jgi:hypothetical protein
MAEYRTYSTVFGPVRVKVSKRAQPQDEQQETSEDQMSPDAPNSPSDAL